MADFPTSLRELEHDFQEYGERWKNFGRRICKNGFVYRHLLKIQGGRCPQCRRAIRTPAHIHHLDYAHLCRSDDVPPDCRECNRDTPGAFQSCIRRLLLVHRKCHMAIHGIRPRPRSSHRVVRPSCGISNH